MQFKAAIPRLGWIILVFGLLLSPVTPTYAEKGIFYNPLMSGADPSVVYRDGFYYLVQSDGDLWVTKSATMTGLGSGTRVKVWTRAASGGLCCNVWAPELLFLNNKWYIYFAADDGNNDNHRMYVIESTGANPQGSYYAPKKIAAPTDRWAIDGTVLQKDDGSLYFLWSGWAGTTNGQQNLYIAPMSSPTTISGERVLISQPTNTWERIGGPPYINEGPEVLKRNGKIFLVYSASGSWTDDYCLGMLTATSTANVLLAGSWTKSAGCVFSKNTGAYGPGHNTFTTSPDGSEDWHLYHANTTSGTGWNGRTIRAQKINWNADGTPNFGRPAPANTAVVGPSGEIYEAEHATINRATARTACCGASNGRVVGYIDYADSYVEFYSLNVPTAGNYAVTVRFANGSGATSTHNVSVNGIATTSVSYPHTGWDNWTSTTIRVNLNAGNNTIRFSKGTNYAELDYIDIPRYEAEYAAINHATTRTACCGASNGRVAAYIDYADSYVHFNNINVPSAGTYTLTVRFANGSGATSTHNVSVNGGANTSITYPNTGWDNWSTVTMSVNLNAGNNTIRFSKGTNYAELDAIEVSK
jgi:GH43 family beta-xylosidase